MGVEPAKTAGKDRERDKGENMLDLAMITTHHVERGLLAERLHVCYDGYVLISGGFFDIEKR